MTTQLHPDTTVGFIGSGNMAAAIVTGAVNAGVIPAERIILFDVATSVSERLAQRTGARQATSLADVVDCGVIVLAVKPQVIHDVTRDVAAMLGDRRPLVISIAAGTSLTSLETLLPVDVALVRAMPNVNAMVGASMTALCGNAAAGEQELAVADSLFTSVGETVTLAEQDFSAFTAIAGSAPAFVFEFIDALAAAAVAHGLPKAQATSIATQTVLGSARTVAHGATNGRSPADLADMVSSPGGTTIAGRLAMARAGFAPAVVTGVDAVVARDRAMSTD